MRRTGLTYQAIAVAVAGAIIADVALLAAYWWSTEHTTTEFGVYAYSTPRRYVDYLPSRPPVDWWHVLLPATVTGAVVALVLAFVFRLVYLRLRSSRS